MACNERRMASPLGAYKENDIWGWDTIDTIDDDDHDNHDNHDDHDDRRMATSEQRKVPK